MAYIGQIKVKNSDLEELYPIGSTLYGVCNTEANEPAKIANTGNLAKVNSITDGLTIHVKFIHSNTASEQLTLKVGSLDPKPIITYGSSTPGTTPSASWQAGAVVSFTLDGTSWVMNTGVDLNSASSVINGLNTTIAGMAANKTLKTLGETNGIINATFEDIEIAESQVTNLTTHLDEKAPINDPTFTGTPELTTTPTAGDNSHAIADTAFVIAEINSKLAANDAMLFKGTIGTGGTITDVPNGTSGQTYQAGYTYKVITAGTYAGHTCEEGDLLIAITDSATDQNSIINSHWTVAQTNIDGAVTASDGAADYLTKFNGTHTVTKGPKITSGGTRFLKEDGTWDTPTNPGYGSITPANTANGTSALTGNTTAVTAINNSENIKFTGANKWIVLAGSNGAAGKDELKFAHFVPSNITNSGPTGAQTGTRGSTFNIPKVEVDAAGHVTSISSITVSLPASDNTDEKLAIASENPSTSTAYNLIFAKQNTDNAATRYYSTDIQHITLKGTASDEGYSILALGNNIATGTVNNKKGILRLYGTSTSYTDIVGANNTTIQVLTLPKTTGGNLVGTNTTSKVGNTNKPVYIAANGIATAISYTINANVPAEAVFTDTTYTPTANTIIHYLGDANYVKTTAVSDGILTITTVTNASSITPITAITPSVAGPTN